MEHERKEGPLPAAGTAFAVPLKDGRFGVCRVIRSASREEADMRGGGDFVLVACSAWIGDAVPDVHDPNLRPILHLTHHAWENTPEVLWISDPPPEDFMPIGTIEPSLDERGMKCMIFGDWRSVQIQPLAQWRWDNERDKVLAEDKIKAQQQESQAGQREQQKHEQS